MTQDKSLQPGVEWEDLDNDAKYLVENTDLSPLQAIQLIREHGHDRITLLKIAETMKAES